MSCYGPGLNAPVQLFGGYPREQSMEELRLRHYEMVTAGRTQEAFQEADSLYNFCLQQTQSAAQDVMGAINFINEGERSHPNRIDICEQFLTGRGASSGGVSGNPFGSGTATGGGGGGGGFGQPTKPGSNATPFASSGPTVGQPSQVGQRPSPFASSAPAFGQPSQLGARPSPFAPTGPAFGQPSQLGPRPSPFATMQTTAAGISNVAATAGPASTGFGATSQPANAGFGQPSQPLSSAVNPFGQPSQPQASGFAQPSGGAFGKPSQPSSSAVNPFGKPSQPQVSGFGQPSGGAFGQMSPQQPSSSAPKPGSGFGQPSPFAPKTGSGFGQVPTTSAGSGAPSNPAVKATKPKATAGKRKVKKTPKSWLFSTPPAPIGTTGPETTSTVATSGGPNEATPLRTSGGSSSGDQVSGSSTNSPYPPDAKVKHPDIRKYSTRDANNRLLTWKGNPVEYHKDIPYYRREDGDLERIIFPDGPPEIDRFTARPESEYDQETKDAYAYVREHGVFPPGGLPFMPPRPEWCKWDF
ncbi:MAG: hypothetical protein M1823_001630 [Watsoniomyces obsoletus]|nr:MAG: hypothetical protein M1823_001630 [Watsoniomyces obsoletus]